MDRLNLGEAIFRVLDVNATSEELKRLQIGPNEPMGKRLARSRSLF